MVNVRSLGPVPEGIVRGLVPVPGVTRPRPPAHRLVRSHLADVGVEVRQVRIGHAAEPDLADQAQQGHAWPVLERPHPDRKSTRLNSSHSQISYAVFCLKKKKKRTN